MADLYVTNSTQNLNNASSSLDVLFRWNLDKYQTGSHLSINDHADDHKYSKVITNDGTLNAARSDPSGADGGTWCEFGITLQYNMLYNILLSDTSGDTPNVKSYLLTPSNLNVSFVTTNNDIFTQDVNVDVNNYMLTDDLLQDLSMVPFKWKPELSVVNFSENVLHVSDNFNTLTDLSSTLYDSSNISVNDGVSLAPRTDFNIFHKMVLDYSYNAVDVKLKGFDVEEVVRTDQYPHAVNLPDKENSGFYEITRDNQDFATKVDISWNNPNNLNIADVSLGLYYVVTLTQDNNNTDFSDIDISKVVLATTPNNTSFTIGVSGDIVAVNTSSDISLEIVSNNTNTTNDISNGLAEVSDLFKEFGNITIANPPDAPTGVVLTRVINSNDSLNVSWNAPTNDGGKAISNYIVSYENVVDSNDKGENSTGNTDTTLTLSGLTEGVTYSVNVRAVNDVGESPVSSPDVSLNPAVAPDAPTGVVLTRVVNDGNSLNVSWTAPDANGDTITNYIVSYANTNPNNSTDKADVSNGDANTTLTLSGLNEGDTYNVNVRAVNDVSGGPVSSPEVSLNPAVAPDAPTGVVLTRVVNDGNSLDVSWTAPDNNGDTITNYIVSYENDDSTDKGDVSNGDANTSLTLSGLNEGDTYNVNVRAVNDVSGGEVSSPDVSLNPAVAPDAPTGVVLTRVDNSGTSLNVSWTAPDANGDTITNYIVSYANTNPNNSTDKADVSNGDANTTLTLSGLNEGDTYNVNVRAVNDVSGGPVSSPEVSLNPAVAPDAPTGVVLTRVANDENSLDVSWTAPDNNGDTITNYIVSYANTNPNNSTDKADVSNGNANTTLRLTGLAEGDTYNVNVRAVNDVSGGEVSSPDVSLNPAVAPDAPTGVVLTRVANDENSLDVSWNAPDNNGDTITNYIVSYENDDSTDKGDVSNGDANTSLTLSGLNEGDTYNVNVRAVNDVSGGEVSSPDVSLNPAVAPDAPTFTLKNRANDDNVDLTIIPPSGNGDAIYEYEVTTTIDGSDTIHTLSREMLSTTFGDDDASFNTNNVENGELKFKIRARNTVDYSAYSTTKTIIISDDPEITLDASNVPLSKADGGPELRVFSNLTVPGNDYKLKYKLEFVNITDNTSMVIYDYKLTFAEGLLTDYEGENKAGVFGTHNATNLLLTYTHDISSSNFPVLGRDYQFVVTLENDPSFNSGEFLISEQSDVIRAAVLPPAPTINNVTMTTNDLNVLVDWSNNTTPNNIDISYNEISIISNNSSNNSEDILNQRVEVDVLSYNINTLLLGQAYDISVSSVNTLGEGFADSSSVTVVGEPTFKDNSIEFEYVDASGDLVVKGQVVTKGNRTRVDMTVLGLTTLLDSSSVLPFEVDPNNNNVVDFSFNVSGLDYDTSYNINLNLYLEDSLPGGNDLKDDFSLNNVLLFNKAEPPSNVVLNRSVTNDMRSLTVTFENPSHNGSSNKYEYTLKLLDVSNNNAVVKEEKVDQSNVTINESNSHTFVDNSGNLNSNYKVVVNVTQYDENGALLTELSSNIVESNETYFSLDPSANIQAFQTYVTDFSNNFLVNYKDNTFDFAVKYDLSMYDLKDFDLTVELKDSSDTLVQDLSYNTNNASDISFSFNDISLNNTYKLKLNLNVTDWDSPLNQIEDISHTVDLLDTSLNDKFDDLSFVINTSNISDSKLTLTVNNIQKTGNYNNLSDDSLNVLCNISVVDGSDSVVVLDLSSVYSTNLSFNVDISNVDISNGTTDLTQLISKVSLYLYSDSRSMDLSKNNIVEKYLLFKPSLLSADLSDNTYTVKFYNGFSSGEVLYINTSNGNMDSSKNTYVDNDYVKNDDGIQSMDITGVTAPEVDGNSWFILVNESGASVYQIYGGSGPDNNINNVTNLS